MADTKISALTAVSSVAGTEAIPCVSGGATKSATPAQILAYIVAQANTWAANQTTTARTLAYVAKTSAYGIGTDLVEVIDCTANSFTVTLPTAASKTGRTYTIKNSGSGTTITIACTGGETIDGEATILLNVQYQALTVLSDGTNWKVI